MSPREFWLRNHLNISGVCLSGFALCASFSISLTQIFLGLSLLSLVIDLILFQKSRARQQPTQTEKALIGHFSSYRLLPVFYYLMAWAFIHFIHLWFSSDFLKELLALREIWLLSILPLVIFRIPEKKWFHTFWVCLILGAASTGAYNLWMHLKKDLSIGSYRVGGFFDTMHTLSYTGITGILFFLSLGVFFWFWKERQKKLACYTFLGNVFIFIGFFLSQSRGGYIAFCLSMFLFLALALRKKFIFALPVLLILTSWFYQNIPGVSEKFIQAKNEFYHYLKTDQNCGTIQERIHFWETGLKIWSHHPLIGVGNFDYEKAYQKYHSKKICGAAESGSPHLHNDFLNTLVLFGSIGFSIFIMFYLFPFMKLFEKFIIDPGNTHLWLMIGAASAIGMMFFLGFSQCHFTDEEVQMVFWIVSGLFFRKGVYKLS